MIIDFLIIHDEIDAGRRLYGDWKNEVMRTVGVLRDDVHALLGEPTAADLGIEDELETLESSFEQILDYVPVVGGGHELKRRIRNAGTIAQKIKTERIDDISLGHEPVEATRDGLLTAQRQLRRLTARRGERILADRGLRRWRKVQEETGAIGYGVLRVLYFGLTQVGVSDGESLQGISRELQMIGARRTEMDGG